MEQLSYAVGSNYVIARNIIKYMTWQETQVAEQVCELWQEVVKELRKSELHVRHFCLTYIHRGRSRTSLFVTNPGCFGMPDFLITFQPKLISCGPFRCPLNSCPMTLEERSRICGYCANDNISNEHACSFCNSDTKVIAVRSTRIFYVQTHMNRTIDHFMGGLVIPKIPGVQTNILNIVKDVYSDPSTFYSKLNEIMDTNIIKCLLIFLTNKDCVKQENYVKKMVSDIRTKQESTHPTHQFAVCGGITHNSHDLTDLNNTDDNTVKVVIFSVKKSEIDSVEFSAFSSVFSFYSPSKSRMLNNYRDQMKKISDLIPLRKFGICIKISCFKRNKVIVHENAILAEHFINMPMIGCEANGELGVNCLPTISNEPPNIKKVRQDLYDDCTLAFSTVIIILTWGRLL